MSLKEETLKYDQRAFVIPETEDRFPFDAVKVQIVEELEKRNWIIPGVDIVFRESGTGDEKYRSVHSVTGKDFKLYFGFGFSIVMPGKQIDVYDDEGGPTLYLYVGDNWDSDKEGFMNSSKFHAKLNNEPRLYLKYSGTCHCGINRKGFYAHTHTDIRSPLIAPVSDDREYSPEGDEPTLFRTSEVLTEFKTYLEDVVLKEIMSYPVPLEKVNIFVRDVIPFPEFKGIFQFGDHDDERRIKHGKSDPTLLHPKNRYAFLGNTSQWVSLDTYTKGVAKIFSCGLQYRVITSTTDTDELPYVSDEGKPFTFRIKPNRANDIYIADHGAYTKKKTELEQLLNERTRFTDEEVDEMYAARNQTIIPINEYEGGYSHPIIFISRELSFDEVEPL